MRIRRGEKSSCVLSIMGLATLALASEGCSRYEYEGTFRKQASKGSVVIGETTQGDDLSAKSTGGWQPIEAITQFMLGTKTPVGGLNSKTVVLKNLGDTTVTRLKLSIQPATAANHFGITTNCDSLRGLGSDKSVGPESCTATITFHPQIIGRPSRFACLKELVEHARRTPKLWLARLDQIAAHARTALA